MEDEKKLVRYEGTWWVLEKITDGGTVVLYRNGETTIAPKELITYQRGEEPEE